jgi:dTDP-4-dehydrorhamnose reductase
MNLCDERYEGILHIAGNESCNKLDFAYHVANVFGLDDSLIIPISIDDMYLKAKRAKNLSLDASRARKILNLRLPSIREGLIEMKRLKESGYREQLQHL